jgi:uncharacterized delta-60 repeat protein
MKSTSTIKTIYILFISLFCFLPTVSAAPGDLDPTFSQDGKIIHQFGTSAYDYSRASALQTDGKIILAGIVNYGGKFSCGIVRYNPDGTLDTTFDGDGKTFVRIRDVWNCRSMALQTDGKIVLVGATGREDFEPGMDGDFVVVRLNADGSLDTTFDGDGKVITRLSEFQDMANDVAIQPDGKIVVTGIRYTGIVGGWYVSDFATVRYNADGSLDTTFDADGIVTTKFSDYQDIAFGVGIQPDGKIVVVGNSYINTVEDFALVRYNPDGSLDTTFDSDGKVVSNLFDSDEVATSVVIQADGKILTAGSYQSGNFFVLARYNSDGSPDTKFGDNGKTSTPNSVWFNQSNDLAVQPDGKIVAALNYGETFNSNKHFAVYRFNSDGSPDATFDGDGKAVTAISDVTDFSDEVLIQPDGKIVLTGFSGLGSDAHAQTDFAVVRYNSDGSLDNSFSDDGKTTTDVGITGSQAVAVANQPDGKIVAAGGLYITRYNPDGTPDSTFDGDGMATLTDLTASALAIQPDGKIVVGGVFYNSSGAGNFAVVRLNTDGSLDTTFDGDGRVITTIPNNRLELYDIAIQTDGKIVAVGSSTTETKAYFALTRYNPNGSPDTTFNGSGIVLTEFSNGGDRASAVLIQTDGKIVAAGSSYQQSDGIKFAAARYNSNGTLDNSFDNDGKVTVQFPYNANANSAALQPNGKIILAGNSAEHGFALARLNSDGTLDTSFDGDGKLITAVSNNWAIAYAVEVQADGKIMAAGSSNLTPWLSDFTLVRYKSDGSLDSETFGNGGIAKLDLQGEMSDSISDMVIDSQGRAVVVGESGGFFTVARVLTEPAANTPFDFDGDHKTDISIYRPGAGEWWINRSSTASTVAAQFGNSTDKIVPGDFTGDGKTDIAVWRPATGEWFVLRSEDNSYYSVPFGSSGDVPVPADFDGDGKSDLAVYRPSSFTWYISKSSGGYQINAFGAAGDVPVVGDYDRDGKVDIAIYRPSTGAWWIQKSATDVTLTYQFGNSTDIPVQGDYTGDGRTDSAVWRPSTGEWFILRSEDNSYYSVSFGATGDIPTPGDYDGDGKFDTAVFRPTDTNWYINRSNAGLLILSFGLGSDRPVPSAFVP